MTSQNYLHDTLEPLPQIRALTLSETASGYALRQLDSPELAADFFRLTVRQSPFFDPEKEAVCTLLLDRKNRLKAWTFNSLGTQTGALLEPREVLRTALIANAVAIVVMHNHPSGDPKPSSADAQITRQLREACKIMNVEFLDHVVIGTPEQDPNGNQGFYSFRQAGLC